MKIPKSVLWLTGVSTAVGVFLLSKKSTVVPLARVLPTPTPPPPIQYGEQTRVSLAVPTGWRRATDAEVAALPELSSRAVAVMNTPGFTTMPYGTLSPFVASNGKTYATWIEQHYRAPGSAAKPWGLHHGVSILAAV